jgi:hypothetical protein
LDFEKRKVFQKIDNVTNRDFQEFNSTLEDNLFDKIYKMTQEQQNGFITYDYKSMIGSENSLKPSRASSKSRPQSCWAMPRVPILAISSPTEARSISPHTVAM